MATGPSAHVAIAWYASLTTVIFGVTWAYGSDGQLGVMRPVVAAIAVTAAWFFVVALVMEQNRKEYAAKAQASSGGK